MNDNSIITKYELSEKEKKLRQAFFNSKPRTLKRKVEESKNNSNVELITDEDISKFIADNSATLYPSAGMNGVSPQQMNMIYTQNKLMERNVDLLQENQRSFHDFVLYLLRKDAQNAKSKISPHQLKEVLNPLYANLSELKNEMKRIKLSHSTSTGNENYDTNIKNSNLNAKVDELVSLNKEINREKRDAKSLNQIVNNKQNAVVLKAISDIKTSMGTMSDEISKMGNSFQEKINKVIEETEKDKMKNILNVSSKPKEEEKLNLSNNSSFIKAKILDDIDYNAYKNDILDINFRKDEIVKEFRKKTPIVPDLKKPKGKVNFSYNLDFPTSTSSNLSQSSCMFDSDTSKNIFNQNLANNPPQKKSTNVTSSNYNKPTQYSTMWNNNENSTSVPHYENNPMPFPVQDDQNQPRVNNEHFDNIADKMKVYKEKMKNNKSIETVNVNKINQSESVRSLNPFAMDNYQADFASSDKSKVTLKDIPPQNASPIVEYNPIPKQPPYKVGVFQGQVDLKPVDRKEITMINVAPKEKEDRALFEDVLLKLCADKIKQRNSNVNKPIPIMGYPHGVQRQDMEKITEQTVKDYIRELMKKKPTKDNISINIERPQVAQRQNGPNEICKVYEKEYVHNTVNNNNGNNNNELLEQLMKQLVDKFGGIEAALNNLNIGRGNIREINSNQGGEANLDEVAQLISEKLKTGINVKVNLKDQYSNMQRGNNNNNQGNNNNSFNVPGSSNQRIRLGVNKQSTLHYTQSHKDKSKDQPTQQSEIFDDNRKIEIEELDQLIQMPHRINLAEYEISQTSSYISDIKNESKVVKNEVLNVLDESHNSNSLSRGQVVTDQSDFSESLRNEKNRNGLDLLMLKNFNENLPQNIIQNFGNEKMFEEDKKEYSLGEVRSGDEYEEEEYEEEEK